MMKRMLLGVLAAGGLAATLAIAQSPARPPPTPQPAAQTGTPQQPRTVESQSLPSIAPLIDSVRGAVVNVDVTAKAGNGRGFQGDPFGGGDEFFDRFFGGPGGRGGREQLRQGMGSGFIVDPTGVVLTNNHVVEGAVSIRVRLHDGRTFDAKVIGRDPLTDVAVIKLQGKLEKLPVVKLGDSDALRVGDWVVAIGNPFGLASSVSLGILSAKAREIGASQYDDFLQTDAAINPGNSGGPLFNMKGEVVGINTAIVGGGSGIGFAVPSNLVKALLPQLEKTGVVTRGYIGIGIDDLTPALAEALNVPVPEGALVIRVEDGSPASKAGLRVDDVVVAIDGEPLEGAGDLTRTVALKKPGTTSTLTIYRGGKKQDVRLTLGKRADDLVARGELSDQDESEQKFGLTFRDVDPKMAQALGVSANGVLITDVVPGSPADRAGLIRGMVIVEADRKPVRTAVELSRIIRGAKSGSTVLLRVEVPQGGGRRLRALRVP